MSYFDIIDDDLINKIILIRITDIEIIIKNIINKIKNVKNITKKLNFSIKTNDYYYDIKLDPYHNCKYYIHYGRLNINDDNYLYTIINKGKTIFIYKYNTNYIKKSKIIINPTFLNLCHYINHFLHVDDDNTSITSMHVINNTELLNDYYINNKNTENKYITLNRTS